MKIKRWLLLVVISLCFEAAKAEDRPLKVVTPESFLAANPSAERKDIVDFIIRQVHEKPVVTQAQLDEVWAIQPNSHRLRLQIIDQKLYADIKPADSGLAMSPLLYIQKLLGKYKISDIDAIINLGDFVEIDYANTPSFAMTKNSKRPIEVGQLLLPDEYMFSSGWQQTLEKVSLGRELYSWPSKEDKVFWRGAASGIYMLNKEEVASAYNIENLSLFPRLRLAILSGIYPDMIDSKFTSTMQIEKSKSGEKLKYILDTLSLGDGTYTSEADHLKYKYLISLDGHSAAWKRVPWIMFSNSALVKPITSNSQWFYSAMKPYVHFIPINENLTDLTMKIEWMRANDVKVQEISDNAHNFVKNELMPEHIEAHMVLIFNEYHKLHNGEVLKPSLPNGEHAISKLEDNILYKQLSTWDKIKALRKKLIRYFKSLFNSPQLAAMN